MVDQSQTPGPYTLANLGHMLLTSGPAVLHAIPSLAQGFVGKERLQADTRVAIQLRLARRFGCPVCVGLFPQLGRRAGLSDEAIGSSFAGREAGLAPEAAAALVWVEALLDSHGAVPEAVPDGAATLTEAQRRHLVAWVRLDRVIHSVGLMFLPRAWVEKAHRG